MLLICLTDHARVIHCWHTNIAENTTDKSSYVCENNICQQVYAYAV